MTIQTKCVLPISDIASVQFTCKCGSKLSVPISRLTRGAPARCTQCNEDWDFAPGMSEKNWLDSFLISLVHLDAFMQGRALSVSLECPSASASDRAVGGMD